MSPIAARFTSTVPVVDARARLYFWGEYILYLGPGFEATMHAHHATQVVIELEGVLRLRSSPDAAGRRYRGAIIPPDVPHESVDVADFLGVLFFDAESRDGRRFVHTRRNPTIQTISATKLQRIVPLLRACWAGEYDAQQAAYVRDSVVDVLASTRAPRRPQDPRIARVRELLETTPDRRVDLERAADAVDLSPSRLRHIFREETGVPFRRYRLWLRLQDAVRELSNGASLTDAAHASGFSDSAHLSRTFRRMIGFSPSNLLAVSRFVQVRT